MDMRRKKEEENIGVCQKLYDFLMNKISLHGMKRVTLGISSSKNEKTHDEGVARKLKNSDIGADNRRRKREVKEVEFVDGEVKIERKEVRKRSVEDKKASAVDVLVEGSELDNIDEKLQKFIKDGKEKLLISESRK